MVAAQAACRLGCKSFQFPHQSYARALTNTVVTVSDDHILETKATASMFSHL